jgi:Ribonuclease G/E
LEALDEKRVLFDNIAFYENIDTFYANELENDYVEYIQYVNDPVPIFEKYANEMKIDEIDQYILERSREA